MMTLLNFKIIYFLNKIVHLQHYSVTHRSKVHLIMTLPSGYKRGRYYNFCEKFLNLQKQNCKFQNCKITKINFKFFFKKC